jgi:glucan phosphoethanolaminetransferase (alkaline phosphatase superfamily)
MVDYMFVIIFAAYFIAPLVFGCIALLYIIEARKKLSDKILRGSLLWMFVVISLLIVINGIQILIFTSLVSYEKKIVYHLLLISPLNMILFLCIYLSTRQISEFGKMFGFKETEENTVPQMLDLGKSPKKIRRRK